MDKVKERMYDLAYRFKTKALWNDLSDDQLFAVAHADGAISYCSVLGMLAQHYALNVYTGPEGYSSYLRLIDIHDDYQFVDIDDDPFAIGELKNAQKCLSCCFENLDSVSDEEAKEVRAFARTHGISLRGRNMYVVALDFTPGLFPWKIEPASDMVHMCEALEAAIYLANQIEEDFIDPYDIESYSETSSVPLFTRTNQGWEMSETPLPKERFAYPKPLFTDDLTLYRIRKMRKAETWQCGAFFSPAYVGDIDKGERPCYPLIMLGVTEETGFVRPIHMEKNGDPGEFAAALADDIARGGHCPKAIQCADERSYSLIEDFCKKAGIQLEYSEDLDEYKDAEYDLFCKMSDPQENFDEEEMLEAAQNMFEELGTMSDAELLQMPHNMVQALKHFPGLDQFWPDLYKRINRLFPD